MYKLERKENKSSWYDVMLCPFNTKEELKIYHTKYSKCYPATNSIYRVTNLKTGKMENFNEYI